MKSVLLLILMVVHISVQSITVHLEVDGREIELEIKETNDETVLIKQETNKKPTKYVSGDDIIKAVAQCLLMKIVDSQHIPTDDVTKLGKRILNFLHKNDISSMRKTIISFNKHNVDVPNIFCDEYNSHNIQRAITPKDVPRQMFKSSVHEVPNHNLVNEPQNEPQNEQQNEPQNEPQNNIQYTSIKQFGDEGIITRDFKHNAMIFSKDKLARICAGAILNKKLILTSATCIVRNKLQDLYVITGPYDDNHIYSINKAFFPTERHELNNIAILRVTTPMRLKSLTTISPAYVSPKGDLHVTGSHCRCSGVPVLYKGVMKIIPKEECSEFYPDSGDESFCAVPVDDTYGRKCYEEQGGAVVSRGKVVGVIGRIIGGKPSRYISLRPFKKWLSRICAKHGDC